MSLLDPVLRIDFPRTRTPNKNSSPYKRVTYASSLLLVLDPTHPSNWTQTKTMQMIEHNHHVTLFGFIITRIRFTTTFSFFFFSVGLWLEFIVAGSTMVESWIEFSSSAILRRLWPELWLSSLAACVRLLICCCEFHGKTLPPSLSFSWKPRINHNKFSKPLFYCLSLCSRMWGTKKKIGK